VSAADDALRVTRDGDVVRLHLNMPETGNRIPQAVVTRLARELQAVAADATAKLVLITAEGAHFCQGRDQSKVTVADKPTALELRTRMMDPIVDVYTAFRAVQVPIVALVQGEAHGFGAALAGSADITIAAEDARFSFPEMKSDMPPTLAMATVIDRVAPKALAWMVYTTDSVSAADARQAGLVSHVVPAAELAAAGQRVVDQLLQRSRPALVGVKQYIAQARLQDFAHAADYGRNLLAVVLSSR
jgi:enoyl-CoA hydratase/carnithine racemase